MASENGVRGVPDGTDAATSLAGSTSQTNVKDESAKQKSDSVQSAEVLVGITNGEHKCEGTDGSSTSFNNDVATRKSKRLAKKGSDLHHLKSKQMCYEYKPKKAFSKMNDLLKEVKSSRKREGSPNLDDINPPNKIQKQSKNSSTSSVGGLKLSPSEGNGPGDHSVSDDIHYDFAEIIGAVKGSDYEKVTTLLKSCKTQLNCRDEVIQNILNKALWHAVLQEDLFLVQQLVFHHAEVAKQHNINCFLYAAEKGYVGIVEILVLSYKDLVNVRDDSGHTALHLCQKSSNNAQITKILITSGADVNVTDTDHSVLEIALQHRNLHSVCQLIRAGACVYGSTLIKLKDLCTRLGSVNILNIRFGSSGSEDLYPIMSAIEAEDVDLLEVLLLSGYFNVNAWDQNGETPLLKIFHMKGQAKSSMYHEISNSESKTEIRIPPVKPDTSVESGDAGKSEKNDSMNFEQQEGNFSKNSPIESDMEVQIRPEVNDFVSILIKDGFSNIQSIKEKYTNIKKEMKELKDSQNKSKPENQDQHQLDTQILHDYDVEKAVTSNIQILKKQYNILLSELQQAKQEIDYNKILKEQHENLKAQRGNSFDYELSINEKFENLMAQCAAFEGKLKLATDACGIDVERNIKALYDKFEQIRNKASRGASSSDFIDNVPEQHDRVVNIHSNNNKQANTNENDLANQLEIEDQSKSNLQLLSDVVSSFNKVDNASEQELCGNKKDKATFTKKQWAMIEMLLKAGARISLEGKNINESLTLNPLSPLLLSLAEGDNNLLKFLIERQRTVVYDKDWSEALGMTIDNGRLDLIEILAPVMKTLTNIKEYKASDFENTLFVGIQKSHSKCVERLAQLIKGYNFVKAVSTAAKKGLKMLKLLHNLEPKQFIELARSDVGTQWLCDACDGNNIPVIRFLVSSGANINGSSAFNDHPIAHCKAAKTLDFLLDFDIDFSKYSNEGINFGSRALESAIEKRKLDLVKRLLKRGAKIDANVMIFVLKKNKEFALEGLKMKRCILTCRNNYALDRKSKNPINEAIDNSDTLSARTLLENRLDPNHHLETEDHPLHKAALCGSYNAGRFVEVLLKHGANPEVTNQNSDNVLHLMANKPFDDFGKATELVVKKCTNSNLNATNKDGNTPLMIAAKRQNKEVLSALIKGGADLNVVRPTDTTTVLTQQLRLRSYKREPTIIKDLIMHGASTNEPCAECIHNLILEKEYHSLRVLISSGVFSPTLLTKSSIYCKIQQRIINRFQGVFSPLCMAVLCGQVILAKDMLKINFITPSDLVLLPKNGPVKTLLMELKMSSSLDFLDDLIKQPPSLWQLSFAMISDQIGSGSQRKESIKKLGLPNQFQRALLFDNKAVTNQNQGKDGSSFQDMKNNRHSGKYEFIDVSSDEDVDSDESDDNLANAVPDFGDDDDDNIPDDSDSVSSNYESDIGTLDPSADKEKEDNQEMFDISPVEDIEFNFESEGEEEENSGMSALKKYMAIRAKYKDPNEDTDEEDESELESSF